MPSSNSLLGALRERGARLARAGRVLAAVSATSLLGGCFDLSYSLSLNPDGSAGNNVAMRFDPEMKEVFGFFEALAELRPEGQLFVRDGICPALELAAAFAPQLPVAVKAKQGVENNRFACQFNIDGARTDAIFGGLAMTPAAQMGFVTAKSEGPKRYRVTIDFAAVPDFKPLLVQQMVDSMNKSTKPGSPPVTQASVERFAKAYTPGMVALTRMGLRQGRIEIAIAAPKVIETNGKNAGGAVRFSWAWDEFVRMLLDAEARRGKTYFAVVEY